MWQWLAASDELPALKQKHVLSGSVRHTNEMQALVADWVSRHPATCDLPAPSVAMRALADYWEIVLKPAQLSSAFRSERSQYLVLAVGYFIPF